jgi:transcriptional regulator with XRE-family HTH domain
VLAQQPLDPGAHSGPYRLLLGSELYEGQSNVLRVEVGSSSPGDVCGEVPWTEYIQTDIVWTMNVVRDLRESRGLTQVEFAELARTSQPTVAAYESGRKSPNLRTLERLARAAGLDLAIDFVSPMTREERRSLALHRVLAARLGDQPGPVLRRARRNLGRMLERHPGARELLSRWRRILRRPVPDILEVMLDPRPSARELRQVTPFAGVLTASERASFYRRFASTEAARE